MVITGRTQTISRPSTPSSIGAGSTPRSGSFGSSSPLRSGGKNNISPFKRPQGNATQANKGSGSSSISKGIAKTVSAVEGKAGKISPGIGVNAKGDLDFGLRAGGVGLSLSTKGDISVGFGVGSITIDTSNPNTSAVDFGLGYITIDAVQSGCDVIITTRMGGKIVSQETRQADECREPEPEPEPEEEEIAKEEDEEGNTTTITRSAFKPGYRYYTSTNISYSQTDYYGNSHSGSTTWDSERHGWNQTDESKRIIISYSYTRREDIRIGSEDTGIMTPDLATGPGTLRFYFDEETWNKIIVPAGGVNAPYSLMTLYGIETDNYTVSYTWDGKLYEDDDISNFLTKVNGSRSETFKMKSFDPFTLINKNKPRSLPVKCECDCELIERIYDMLGGDPFYEDGLNVPNELFTPEGLGDTKIMTYNTILNVLFRTFDHRTPGQVEVKIKDNNKSKKGDQTVTFKSINATGYYSKLMELQLEGKGENADQLQILIRLGWISTQILKVVVICSEALKTIIKFFVIPTKEVVESVDIPFDPSLKKFNKGFKKEPDQNQILKILDMDTEDAAERILADFNDVSKMPVKVQRLRGGKERPNFWWLLGLGKK
jgi:hypothetical protein